MSRFRSPAITQAALALVLGDEFDLRESLALLGGSFAQPTTRPLGYAFLKQHWDTLVDRLTPQRAMMLPLSAVSFCDEAHRSDLESFFAERQQKLPGGPRLYAQALERLTLCVKRVAAERPSVASFLREQPAAQPKS
jgi:hypothetical protein